VGLDFIGHGAGDLVAVKTFDDVEEGHGIGSLVAL